MNLRQIGSIANTSLNFMVGGGNGIVIDSMRHTINSRGTQNYFKAALKGAGDGFVRSHIQNQKRGGFFTNFWKNTKDAFSEIKIDPKNPVQTSKNIFSGVSKVVPLAMAVYGTVSGIPNIYRAFRDEGFKAGMKETIKTAGRLTTAALLSTVAAGLIKIPKIPCTGKLGVLGTILGSVGTFFGSSYTYLIGDQLGDQIGGKTADLIFGKSYSEKMKELRKQQKKIAKEQAKIQKSQGQNLDIMSYVN